MPKNYEFFQVLLSSNFLRPDFFVPKIYGNEVLQLETKFLKGNFRVGFVYRVGKTELVMATECFHVATASSKKDNRTKQCPFSGRKEQVKFSGRNYFASPFLIWTYSVCYFYRPVTQVNQ